MDTKVYVGVTAEFSPSGQLVPLTIKWEDGNVYEIDQVLGVCRAASMKAGGTGMRYKIRIGSTDTYLFYEVDKWFVERRNTATLYP